MSETREGNQPTVIISKSASMQEEDKHSGGSCGRCSLDKVQLRVYLSHALSAWGDSMWLFAIPIFLMELSPGSLRLTATYGLVVAASIIVLGEIIGRWIDKTQRLKASRSSLILQNVAVIGSAVFVGVEFWSREEDGTLFGHRAVTDAFHVLIIIFANIASLGSIAAKICIEKDWVVVIAANDNARLARMNATFRSIDLLTNIIAPIAVGQIMAYFSPFASAVFICVWNVISVMVEYALLYCIFRDLPELAKKEIPVPGEKKKSLCEHLWQYFRGWQQYFQHEIIWSGLAIASLYMTVLAFHSITIGYAYSQGVSEGMVGICMAVASLVGIAGSTLFPYLVSIFGLHLTGVIGFSAELLALVPSVVALWLPGSPFEMYSAASDDITSKNDSFFSSLNLSELAWDDSNNSMLYNVTEADENEIDGNNNVYTSIIVMLAGIIVARWGLWVADLCVTQIIQENTAEHERGVINGIQASLNMMLETLKYTLVVIVPKIPQFGYLVIASFTFIVIGWMFFFVGWRRNVAQMSMEQQKCTENDKPSAYANSGYI